MAVFVFRDFANSHFSCSFLVKSVVFLRRFRCFFLNFIQTRPFPLWVDRANNTAQEAVAHPVPRQAQAGAASGPLGVQVQRRRRQRADDAQGDHPGRQEHGEDGDQG